MKPRKYNFQEIWRMRYVSRMRQFEIARTLSCSHQTVANILYPRGNKTFTEKMKYLESVKKEVSECIPQLP